MDSLILVFCLLCIPISAFAQMEQAWSHKNGEFYRLTIDKDKVIFREKVSVDDIRSFADGLQKANNGTDMAFQRAKAAFSVMARIELSDGTSWRLKRRNKTNFLRELSHLPTYVGQLKPPSEDGYGGLTVTPFPSSGKIVQVKVYRGLVQLTLGEETTQYLDKDSEMERWLLSTGRSAIDEKKLKTYYNELSLK